MFEEGKSYTRDEIKEIYTQASAKELNDMLESIEKSGSNDMLFNSMVSMLTMQVLSGVNSRLFSKKEVKEDKEN